MTVTDFDSYFLQNLYFIAFENPRLKSNFARKNAFNIAEAASKGLITSLVDYRATSHWFITQKGRELLMKEGYI